MVHDFEQDNTVHNIMTMVHEIYTKMILAYIDKNLWAHSHENNLFKNCNSQKDRKEREREKKTNQQHFFLGLH